jgi:hypothetical protein
MLDLSPVAARNIGSNCLFEETAYTARRIDLRTAHRRHLSYHFHGWPGMNL